MPQQHIQRILNDLGLQQGSLERADSASHEVWIGTSHVVRFHGLGPPGRLAHEARVAARLPSEALYPNVVATGWTDGHDWMVTERVPGEMLSAVWPGLSVEGRRRAITEFAHALRHVHSVDPDGLEPPCLFGGMPFVPRDAMAQRTVAYLRDGDGDRDLLDRAAELATRSARSVDDPADALVHGDLNFNNILWDGRVTAVLDFEWARAEARDVDLLSFMSFCRHAVLCVPEHVEAITDAQQYIDAPRWLHDAYPELFAHPHLRERLVFYDLARWASDLRRPTPAARELAQNMIVDIVEGNGAADSFTW